MHEITRKIIDSRLSSVFTDKDVQRVEPDAIARQQQMALAVKKGDIIPVCQNIYTLNKAYREDVVNNFLLSNLINPASYISMEMALRCKNWIPEHVFLHTCVTLGEPFAIDSDFGDYSYISIPQKNFFAGVQEVHIGNDTHLQAKPLKALADYVYRMNYNWNTLEPLVESLRIEPDDLETLTAADFDEIQGNYETKNVENFLAGIRKELHV